MPVASLKSECIACRRRDDLKPIRQHVSAAMWHFHDILCDPEGHAICSACDLIDPYNLAVQYTERPAPLSVVRKLLMAFQSLAPCNWNLLDAKALFALSGLTRSQIIEIANLTSVRPEKIYQLMVFCRLGLSQRPLAAICGKAQSTISQQLNETLIIVEPIMAATYLRRTRETIIGGKFRIISQLFPDMIGAVDGTYHKIQKSQQFVEQLKSFSMQKKYNLLKTLALITADGKWWDLLGVFFSDSSHNDEMLWEYCYIENIGAVKSLLKDDDLIMVDRYKISCLISLHQLFMIKL